jgi:hypothetical protein
MNPLSAIHRKFARVRETGLHRWAAQGLFARPSVPPLNVERDELHVFLAVCDHYEPDWGRPTANVAIERASRWAERFPIVHGDFADCLGRPPQHTFFYPADEYRAECVDLVAELCRQGFGDVDVHLHHDHDTEESLREKLLDYVDLLSRRHDLLRRDPATGQLIYGFIHGNWALCNSRPDGRWCGVDRELRVLVETGCYADFTYPSAPSCTQLSRINSIYHASDDGLSRPHERGPQAAVGFTPNRDSLLMIQGPLAFDWGRCKYGVVPRVENGDLLGNHPPSLARLRLWLNAGITVAGRPDWRFVKLHTHGCKPGNLEMLLGEPMQAFHHSLADLHKQHPNIRYYYVTAREMAELVIAAEHSTTAAPSIESILGRGVAHPCR